MTNICIKSVVHNNFHQFYSRLHVSAVIAVIRPSVTSMQKNYSQHYAACNLSVSAYREGLIMARNYSRKMWPSIKLMKTSAVCD